MNIFLGYYMFPYNNNFHMIKLERDEISDTLIPTAMDTTDMFTVKSVLSQANMLDATHLNMILNSLETERQSIIYYNFLQGKYAICFPSEISNDGESICFEITQTTEEDNIENIYLIYSFIEKSHFINFLIALTYPNTYTYTTIGEPKLNITLTDKSDVNLSTIHGTITISDKPDWVKDVVDNYPFEKYGSNTSIETIIIPTPDTKLPFKIMKSVKKIKYIGAPLIKYHCTIKTVSGLPSSLQYLLFNSDTLYNNVVEVLLKDCVSSFYPPMDGTVDNTNMIDVLFDVINGQSHIEIVIYASPNTYKYDSANYIPYRYSEKNMHKFYTDIEIPSHKFIQFLSSIMSTRAYQYSAYDMKDCGLFTESDSIGYMYTCDYHIITPFNQKHTLHEMPINYVKVSDNANIKDMWIHPLQVLTSTSGNFFKEYHINSVEIVGYMTLRNTKHGIDEKELWDYISKYLKTDFRKISSKFVFICYHDVLFTRVCLTLLNKPFQSIE